MNMNVCNVRSINILFSCFSSTLITCTAHTHRKPMENYALTLLFICIKSSHQVYAHIQRSKQAKFARVQCVQHMTTPPSPVPAAPYQIYIQLCGRRTVHQIKWLRKTWMDGLLSWWRMRVFWFKIMCAVSSHAKHRLYGRGNINRTSICARNMERMAVGLCKRNTWNCGKAASVLCKGVTNQESVGPFRLELCNARLRPSNRFLFA